MSDSIRVNCPNCEKTIKAPRAAAGKRGKCPYCHTAIYVPTPRDEIEEIPLAPIEGGNEERLRREALDLEAALSRERESPAGGAQSAAGPDAAGESANVAPPTTSVQDAIVDYLVAMQSSSLRAAADIVQHLKRSRHQAKSKIQQLLVDTVPPPRVSGMPQGLYRGFLQKLLEQLES